MLSKALFKITLALLALTAFSACAPVPNYGDEHIIGEKLKDITPLHERDSGEMTNIALFDKTTRRIHQFDLAATALKRSLAVQNPASDHYVLLAESQNYIVDLTLKHLTIFNSQGVPQHQPITFVGEPQSAAFRPSLGLLIIYDDLASVGLVKLSANGDVEDAWVGGPLLSTDLTISSGDLVEDGKLVLALSDGSIAVVDVTQTLAQKKWVYTSFAPTLGLIKWLAPVRGDADLVFVETAAKLALIRLSDQSIQSSYDFEPGESVAKRSKSVDAHLILKKKAQVKVAYVDANQVRFKSHFGSLDLILSSKLNLVEDTWTIVAWNSKEGSKNWYSYNNTDAYTYGRVMSRFRFSDLLASHSIALPDKAQIEISESNIFSLFPSELGYAVNQKIGDGSKSELRLFNLDYIR